MNKHKKLFFVGTTVMFLLATLVGLGSYVTTKDTESYVLKIGDRGISTKLYQQTLNSKLDYYRNQGVPTEAIEPQIKRMVLNDLVTDAIFSETAQQYGMMVPDYEIVSIIKSQPAFFTEGKFNNQMYYRLIMDSYKMSPEEYEKMLRQSLLSEKFKKLVTSAAKVLPDEVEAAYQKEMKGMKDPKSVKDPEAKKREVASNLQNQKAAELLTYYVRKYVAANKVVDFKENL
ncbi:MAG: SurA N-terminal domain-containing protein [Elusimicrobiaceae bacterium]